MTTKTNHALLNISNTVNETELMKFLNKVGFPRHAVIVKTTTSSNLLTYKGIQGYAELLDAIETCNAQSIDGSIQVETDMRAHVNPTRQLALRDLAFKLIRRIRTLCPSCATPGWGLVDTLRGLPCRECEMPTQLVKEEIFGCVKCTHRHTQKIHNPQNADPQFCDYCNP